jgi:tetratricopeptide (TPR) repeat protein
MESNSSIRQNGESKNTCLYCQSFIKKKEDLIFCPECGSPHHLECWYENGGCAQYGCKCRISREQFVNNSQESISEILINAEYLKNINKYIEAINECNRVLKADPRNNNAKMLYNEAVKLVNAKTKLIEEGENAFGEEKFNEAEIFFRKALNFADEAETNLINAKIEIIKNIIPKIRRKKTLSRVLITFIILLIFTSFGYLFYYYYFLEEERELSRISVNDGSSDIQLMEQQVNKYEKFLSNFKNSKYSDNVKNKISLISAMIITAIYKDDWRQAQDYLSKIEEKETRNDLYKKIFNTAIAEYKKLISNAKQFNKLNKFDESKSELERADFIADKFPDSDLSKERNKINSNLLLLDRKRKAQPEVNSIEKKINDISLQLKNFQITDESGITDIEGQVIDKEKNPPIIVLKKLGSKKHIAVSGDVSYYNVGEFVSITCKKVGMVSYGDEDITAYATYSRGILNFDKTEKESLFIELNNLKTRKQKLDSLINLSLN